MSPLGLGSDLGGSIRNPCHFVGVFGLKPGRDTVPFAEHAPLPMSPGIRLMGVVGPMARFVEDLELALGVLAPRTLPAERPARVAVYEEDGLQPVSLHCRAAVRLAAAALADVGYEIAEAAPPNAAAVRGAFDALLVMEMFSVLPAIVAGREDELSPYIRGMLSSARGFEPDLASYFAASEQLSRLEVEAGRWFEEYPVALCPAAPEVAPPLGGAWSTEIDGVPTRPGGKLTLATYASALGLPAVRVPVKRSGGGLPVGVQLIGPRGSERTLLVLAAELEARLGGWRRTRHRRGQDQPRWRAARCPTLQPRAGEHLSDLVLPQQPHGSCTRARGIEGVVFGSPGTGGRAGSTRTVWRLEDGHVRT